MLPLLSISILSHFSIALSYPFTSLTLLILTQFYDSDFPLPYSPQHLVMFLAPFFSMHYSTFSFIFNSFTPSHTSTLSLFFSLCVAGLYALLLLHILQHVVYVSLYGLRDFMHFSSPHPLPRHPRTPYIPY